MAGKLMVKSSDFTQAAAQIEVKNQELCDNLTSIKNAVSKLCTSTWTGEAANKANEKMEHFYSKTFGSYQNAVQEYITFIRNTATTYEAAEENIGSSANMQLDDGAVADFT